MKKRKPGKDTLTILEKYLIFLEVPSVYGCYMGD